MLSETSSSQEHKACATAPQGTSRAGHSHRSSKQRDLAAAPGLGALCRGPVAELRSRKPCSLARKKKVACCCQGAGSRHGAGV